MSWYCPVCGNENKNDEAVQCEYCHAEREENVHTYDPYIGDPHWDGQHKGDLNKDDQHPVDPRTNDHSNDNPPHKPSNHRAGIFIASALCLILPVTAVIALRDRISARSFGSKSETSYASYSDFADLGLESSKGTENQSVSSSAAESLAADENVTENTADESSKDTDAKTQTITSAPSVTSALDGAALNTKAEHRYEAYVEDVTWPEAFERAKEKGGRLAIVRNENEWNKICTALDQISSTKVNYYIGAARDTSIDNGPYYWVYDVEMDGPDSYRFRYFNDSNVAQQTSLSGHWLSEEPSYQDTVSLSSGGTATVQECCLTILRPAGGTGWWLNDASDYLLDAYPAGYDFHGKIGYVVEYDQ